MGVAKPNVLLGCEKQGGRKRDGRRGVHKVGQMNLKVTKKKKRES
jgi:hypothetical protein